MKTKVGLLLLFAVALHFPLLAQDMGYIKARGKPSNAGIWVDGKYVGPAYRFTVPEKYEVAAGEREVMFRDPRYEDYTMKVTVQPKKTAKLKYRLKPAEPAKPPFGTFRFTSGMPQSFMSISAGDTSPVYINERFYGYVDEMNNPGSGLLLPPGTYTVRVSSPFYGEINQQITIEANKTTTIQLQTR